MAQPLPTSPPGFDELSTEEKIEYIQSLWDQLSASPEQVPLPDWHRQVLQERLAEHEANPTKGLPWDQLKSSIERKLES